VRCTSLDSRLRLIARLAPRSFGNTRVADAGSTTNRCPCARSGRVSRRVTISGVASHSTRYLSIGPPGGYANDQWSARVSAAVDLHIIERTSTNSRCAICLVHHTSRARPRVTHVGAHSVTTSIYGRACDARNCVVTV
jgi:hypothetical protein